MCQILTLKIGKKDELRVSLQDGIVDAIILDENRAFMRQWQTQPLDGRRGGARYYLADDGWTCLSRDGLTVRIVRPS